MVRETERKRYEKGMPRKAGKEKHTQHAGQPAAKARHKGDWKREVRQQKERLLHGREFHVP